MYDPTEGVLSEKDRTFLQAIRDKFLSSLLGKVGPNSVRGHMIGKLLAEAERRGISWHSLLARQLPATIEVAQQHYHLSLADRLALDYSRQHAAEYCTELAEGTMEAVRDQITTALENRTSPQELSRKLFDRFGEANLDWRRIALTETAIAVNNGYIASQPEWTILVGDSSRDACDWCQAHIHGRAFRSLPEAPEPAAGDFYSADQSANYMWPGKTNLGRSRHPVDRAGVSRRPHELWHPCVPAHPHCRCRLRRLIESIETIQPGTNMVVQKNGLAGV